MFFFSSQLFFKEIKKLGKLVLLLRSTITFEKQKIFRTNDTSACRGNGPSVTLSGKCLLIFFGQVTSVEDMDFFGKVVSPH